MDQNALKQLQSRTVKILAAGQILGGFGLGSVLSIGALLAEKLSGSAAWSGAAATFSTLGAATIAIPLARLANSRGRRVALATGAAMAISGAILIITAAYVAGCRLSHWIASTLCRHRPAIKPISRA
jgi:MFS family permease